MPFAYSNVAVNPAPHEHGRASLVEQHELASVVAAFAAA